MQQELNKLQSDRLETTVARTLGEVEAIRPIWEQMQSNQSYPIINADIDRYLSVLESQKDRDIRPHVILLQRHDRPEAMVIGRVEKRQLHCRIGYKDIFKPLIRCLTVVYGGILGDENERNCNAIVKELLSTLRRGKVDLVLMRQLRTDSMIYRFAKEMPNFLCQGHFTRVDPHWSISIPDNMEQFYQGCSKNRRKHLKRYIRNLEKEYPNKIKIVTFDQEDKLEEAMKIMSEISRKTYQYGLGCGFVDNAEMRELLTTALRKGWMRIYILYIEDEPCAFRRVLKYGKSYFGQQTGFLPKWREYNVGTILFLKAIEDICKDADINQYDFGFGDGEHKRLGNSRLYHETSVHIFAPRFSLVCLNLLFSSVAGLSLGLNYLSDKAGLTRWLKRRWRDRLQENARDKK